MHRLDFDQVRIGGGLLLMVGELMAGQQQLGLLAGVADVKCIQDILGRGVQHKKQLVARIQSVPSRLQSWRHLRGVIPAKKGKRFADFKGEDITALLEQTLAVTLKKTTSDVDCTSLLSMCKPGCVSPIHPASTIMRKAPFDADTHPHRGVYDPKRSSLSLTIGESFAEACVAPERSVEEIVGGRSKAGPDGGPHVCGEYHDLDKVLVQRGGHVARQQRGAKADGGVHHHSACAGALQQRSDPARQLSGGKVVIARREVRQICACPNPPDSQRVCSHSTPWMSSVKSTMRSVDSCLGPLHSISHKKIYKCKPFPMPGCSKCPDMPVFCADELMCVESIFPSALSMHISSSASQQCLPLSVERDSCRTNLASWAACCKPTDVTWRLVGHDFL